MRHPVSVLCYQKTFCLVTVLSQFCLTIKFVNKMWIIAVTTFQLGNNTFQMCGKYASDMHNDFWSLQDTYNEIMKYYNLAQRKW